MQRCPRGASLQWQRQADTGVFGKEKHTHFLFSLKCSSRACNIPNQMRSWFKNSPLLFEISTRPLMLTWSLQLFAPQHGWRVSPDSWSQWQYFRNPMFRVENLQDKRQPSKRHTESYPRIARSRKKQRKQERDWRIECAQLLLTIFACAKHLAYGSNVRKCSFQHHDHDELSYHGQTCTFLGTDLAPWTKYNSCKAWQDDPVQDPDYEDEERPAEAT